ncbi:flagellar biosynthesis protein FlhB [Sinimarinibacterium sp. CAU 1509]|uniref:flagellar biosynthesis protein FlhB n=1 Tax=Sinimarinibacterium sp. CAU 1509 TaxID=2562283 RepID=UPI0010AC2BD2|nr:flagellar biosynthesis protein FlhB [Sinimarinibacterium sp. CAU 1509]TJY62842.1 flagellar biosynthesis protein FlhB [Sinimarinibacterium sp. CAU 1509]
MSDSSSQDKTERATPKRIREARERGEVPRSRELASFVVVASGLMTLMTISASLAGGAADWMQQALTVDPLLLRNPRSMVGAFGTEVGRAFSLVMPLLAMGFLAGIAAPLMLGGWNLSGKALNPDFKRLNPITGVGRIFSSNSLVELGKALAKATLLGAVAAIYVTGHLHQIMALGREPLGPAMAHGLQLGLNCLSWMCGGLLLLALIDAPYQLWSYAKKLRMSKQDLKQEYKEAEGSPEVKGRLRRLQQEIAQRRMMEDVPTADVVVVNPTHYAVALKYDRNMRAPRVVAKGRDLIATTIRELASRHKIPLVSAPPLARALYRNTQIGDEIPAALYSAVAQVLSYVYQLRDLQAGLRTGAKPTPPRIDDVPGGEPDPEVPPDTDG